MQVTELSHQLQKAKGDVELAEHKMKKVEEEKESLKEELRVLDDIRVIIIINGFVHVVIFYAFCLLDLDMQKINFNYSHCSF